MARVAIILAIIWFFWLITGRLFIRLLSFIPFCLSLLLQILYRLVDFPLGILHSKYAGHFAHIDKAWTSFMRKIYTSNKSWYMKWRHPRKHYSLVVLLLFGIILLWTVLPKELGLQGRFISGAESTYYRIEYYVSERFTNENAPSIGIESPSAPPLGMFSPPALVTSPHETTPTTNLEYVVKGVSTRLLVRDKPSVSTGNRLASLNNGDVVYYLDEKEEGDVENGKIELWLKIETIDGVVGWTRSNYLVIHESS